jgi:hypothetical protein
LIGTVMVSADHVAWQVAEDLRDRFTELERPIMFCALGSGDVFEALTIILDLAVRHGQTVSWQTVAQLHCWLDGYLGNPDEPSLRATIRAITPS